MKKIKNVKILPGCISCGTCEVVCPDVFRVEDVSTVINDADFNKNKDCIEEAVEMCPVSVIKIEHDED